MPTKSEIIEKNIGLVHACAKRFLNRGLEYDDVFQAGCIGLVKAFNAFDSNRGVKFSTYAVPVILGEIKQLFRTNGAIKVSRALKDLSLKINNECENYAAEHGKSPSIGQLAEKFQVEQDLVLEALESSKSVLSLTFNQNDTDEEIGIPVSFEEEKISLKISLLDAINALEKRDKCIVILRFFQGKTQSDTAKILKVNQVWVSRREKVILRQLRDKLL